MKVLGILLAIVVAVAVILKTNYPSYSYRYRLQISLSIDGQVYTGSSVIEIVWECGPKIAGLGRCAPTLGGQAALIDLGPRGVIAATLRSGENISPNPDAAVDAVWLCANAFGNHSTNEELPALQHLTGRRDLSPSNFPRLVWFANAADMKSARKITVQNVANILDPTARFTDAFVEITRDPIVVDIAKKLPWFPALLLAEGKRNSFRARAISAHLQYVRGRKFVNLASSLGTVGSASCADR
jgi:hypothetical protein